MYLHAISKKFVNATSVVCYTYTEFVTLRQEENNLLDMGTLSTTKESRHTHKIKSNEEFVTDTKRSKSENQSKKSKSNSQKANEILLEKLSSKNQVENVSQFAYLSH